jgi:integrase
MLHSMASHYVRKGSPFYWLRVQNPDGTWGAKSSGLRIDAPGVARKLKQLTAAETLKEQEFGGNSNANRFDAWVPGFLAQKYLNAKTLTRYMNAWSAVATYLEPLSLISPSQITYKLCVDYPIFRTNPPKGLMKARSRNTALTELKVFSAILQEAVRRGFITANPCMRLGLKRTPAKLKPEITDDEVVKIEEALQTRDAWMRDCWLVAMRQGCRLSETAVPLPRIDLDAKTISFITKGSRTHTAPIHPDLIPLVREARKAERKTLVELPEYPAKKWHQFFKRIGLPHISFHCTRVTVVTKLARSGAPIYKTKAYVGHASDTVHGVYQRLTPVDVSDLASVLSNPTAEIPDFPAAKSKPTRRASGRRA